MNSNLRNLLLIFSAIFILSSGISCIMDLTKATGLLLILGLIALALQMGKIATVGLAPAIFCPMMNITGSVLANY